MKVKNPNTGNFEEIYVKAMDSMPIGSEVDFSGHLTSIPVGWERITDPHSYSTSEIKTNKTWIDGKPIYRKVLEFTLSSTINSYVKVNHNIENRGVVVSSYGHYTYSGFYFKFPNNSIKAIYVSGSGFYYYNTDSGLSGDTAYAVIEYTKTTD